MNYEIKVLKPDEYKQWDELVIRSPYGTVFHSSEWIMTTASLLSKKYIIFGAFKKNILLAGCSLYSHNKFLFLPFASSTAPMSPYGGFVFAPSESLKVRENEQKYNNIISTINTELKKRFVHVSITNSPMMTDIRPFIRERWNHSVKYSYFYRIDTDIDERLSKKVRWAVRKACTFDLLVEKSKSVEDFIRLHEKTYAKQNISSPVSIRYLRGMINFIISKEIGEIWVARTTNGEPIAAEIIVFDRKKTHRWAAAADPAYNYSGATTLLLHTILHNLLARGYNEINLMAGNTPQLTKFISGFNPDLVIYFSVNKMLFYR